MFDKENVSAEKKSYRRKKQQQRTTAAVITALVLIAVVLANIIVSVLGQKVNTNIDLTAQKVLELSDQTVDLVSNVSQDIQIYSLIPQTMDDELLSILGDMLDRYQKLSPYITYQTVDTITNPQFVQKYQQTGETLDAYTIIFESGNRFKVVDVDDIISVNSQTNQAQYLSAEQKFTSAITYVTGRENPKIAVLEGHGEVEASSFTAILKSENYEVETLDLSTAEVSDDVQVIIVAAPQTDFLAEEIEKLDKFFDRGGKAQIMMDIKMDALPRFEEYLSEWGVTLESGFVVENNKSNYINNQIFLLPDILSTDFTDTIIENKLKIAFPQATGFKIGTVTGVEVQNILMSSDDSFIRTDVNNQEIAMSEDDIPGPITVASLLSRKASTEDEVARLLITGGTGFLNATFLEDSGFANKDFYLNTLSYMTEQDDDIYIRPKDVSPITLAIDLTQALVYGGIVLIAIPLVILLAGLFVWLRRRHL